MNNMNYSKSLFLLSNTSLNNVGQKNYQRQRIVTVLIGKTSISSSSSSSSPSTTSTERIEWRNDDVSIIRDHGGEYNRSATITTTDPTTVTKTSTRTIRSFCTASLSMSATTKLRSTVVRRPCSLQSIKITSPAISLNNTIRLLSSSRSSSNRFHCSRIGVTTTTPKKNYFSTITAILLTAKNIVVTNSCNKINRYHGITTTTTSPTNMLNKKKTAAVATTATATATTSSSSVVVGLFSIPELQCPSDFYLLAKEAIQNGDRIREEIIALMEKVSSSSSSSLASATSTATSTSTPTTASINTTVKDANILLRHLDGISQAVCNVIDAAELCRNVHCNDEWRIAANDTYTTLSDYITQLNSDRSLYNSLIVAIRILEREQEQEQQKEKQKNNNIQESIRFATMLQNEFERDGIHLDKQQRDVVRNLQNHITSIETQFQYNLIHSSHRFTLHTVNDAVQAVEDVIPRSVLMQWPKVEYLYNSNNGNNTITDSTSSDLQHRTPTGIQLDNNDPQILQTLLKYSSNPIVRKEIYMEYMTSIPENLQVLNELQQVRHELALTQGFQSYSDRILRDKMVQTPQAVQQFLNTIQKQNKEQYNKDLQTLYEIKKKVEGIHCDPVLHPWDISYYTNLLKSSSASSDSNDFQSTISEYFTLSNTIHSMQVLVNDLFGITMQEVVPLTPVEQWDINHDHHSNDRTNNNHMTSIRKYNFFSNKESDYIDNNSSIGTMYLDLHPRPGKYGHAAHFTVRCGCVNNTTPTRLVQESSNMKEDDDNTFETYQHPIVALVCNVSYPQSRGGAGGGNLVDKLSHSEVETLFHEFGHALHSLLSRTKYQHVSGTRVAMDFVETPSHLIENFAWDPYFLKFVLSKHYQTGQPMSDELINTLIQSRRELESIERQNQLLYSYFDQQLFGIPSSSSLSTRSSINNNNNGSSNNKNLEMFASLHQRLGIPYAPNTHWYSRFGHLISYGAAYYSYLYSQQFAREIWGRCFAGTAVAATATTALPLGVAPTSITSIDVRTKRRESGLKLWNKVLIHGGSKDPNEMLSDLLNHRARDK